MFMASGETEQLLWDNNMEISNSHVMHPLFLYLSFGRHKVRKALSGFICGELLVLWLGE